MKRSIYVVALVVILSFAIAGMAAAESLKIGNHYNLNIIGFAKCIKSSTTDPDCFNGNAGDIQTSGHTIFVPLKTAQEWMSVLKAPVAVQLKGKKLQLHGFRKA